MRFLHDCDFGCCYFFDELHGVNLEAANKLMCAWLERNNLYSLSEEQVVLWSGLGLMILRDQLFSGGRIGSKADVVSTSQMLLSASGEVQTCEL